MIIWDLGEMNEGLLAVRLPALKIREMRLVLVRRAAYTTVKQNPAPNLQQARHFVRDCMQEIQEHCVPNVQDKRFLLFSSTNYFFILYFHFGFIYIRTN